VSAVAKDWFDNYFDGDYSTKNLLLAIHSGQEIMLRAKSFYGMNIENVSETKRLGFTEIFNLI